MLHVARKLRPIAVVLPIAACCADPLIAPSAFVDERFLCGPEHQIEFEAAVEDCRATRQDSACAGILSLRGNIDSEEVTVDTRLQSVVFHIVPGADPSVAGELIMVAPAPYFMIRMNQTYLAIPPLSSLSGLLPTDCDLLASDASRPCSTVNLEARGGNYRSAMTNFYRSMEVETPTEKRFSFTTDLVRGGFIDGCLHAFVSAPE